MDERQSGTRYWLGDDGDSGGAVNGLNNSIPSAIKKYVLCTDTLVVLKKIGIPNLCYIFLYQQYREYHFQLVIFTSEDIHVILGSGFMVIKIWQFFYC